MTFFKALVLILDLFVQVNGLLFHLYHTNITSSNDSKDCLYSNEINSKRNEWVLSRYCMKEADLENLFDCYNSIKLTFKELKLSKISGEDLFSWNAPIDTIDHYEKYLVEDDNSMENVVFCNCSEHFFGKDCSYSLDEVSSKVKPHEFIFNTYQAKPSLELNAELLKYEHLLTCYEGIKCNSVICLDWRQICDGFMDCENGEDEFADCFLLEHSQCGDNEYRCLNGMCIPKTYLIDFNFDCGDMTDEFYHIEDFIAESNDCYKSTKISCDFSRSRGSLFSCGDGQYSPIDGIDPWCANGRDLFYRRNMFLSSQKNLNFECWFLLLCTSDDFYSDSFNSYDIRCVCRDNDRKNKRCFKYFMEHCPSLFYFQTEDNFVYPFIKFVFNTAMSEESKWWQPTHICFTNRSCSNFLIPSNFHVDGLTCIERKTIPKWTQFALDSLKSVFLYCNRSIENETLFFCNKSQQFISKHHVEDSIRDCYYGEDEDDALVTPLMPLFNLTDRFKCKTDTKWMVRPLIFRYADGSFDNNDKAASCKDESYKLYVGDCRTDSDLACEFIRGTYIPTVYDIFRENCNGRNRIKIVVDNETDETNCEEWSTYLCDNYWDYPNGIDEIDCLDTTTYYLQRTVFKCNYDEYPCANENGTIYCLSRERVGDGITDCLGALDERKADERRCSPVNDETRFKCVSKPCIIMEVLCDGYPDCDYAHDEIICPWINNSSYQLGEFRCKNGTSIHLLSKRCNQIIDCLPDGEDEWFCDAIYGKDEQFSLNNIEEHPPTNHHLLKTSITDSDFTDETGLTQRPRTQLGNSIEHLYCNRGVIVQYRGSNKKCLCPPTYYGSRCQFQSEVVIVTVKIDIPISLSKYKNKHTLIVLVARLIFNEKVFDHEQIIHGSSMKQSFYLNYRRLASNHQGNWSLRLDAYLINKLDVRYKTSWLFPVRFPFLPVHPITLHQSMPDPQACHTLNCTHGTCRKYSNPPHEDYCQCEENWTGKYCNETIRCQCVAGGICIEGRSMPICICPLGRIGNECRIKFNPCADIICKHGGTCLPLDERQSVEFLCSCREGYHGIYCERISSRVHIDFSSLVSPRNFQSETVSAFIHFLRLKASSPGILDVENRFLLKQFKLHETIQVYNYNQDYLSTFILVEVFFLNSVSNYYIGAILKDKYVDLHTKIDTINECLYIDKLIQNETVRKYPLRRKLKYYHYACEMDYLVKCFYDESSLCFCDRYRQPDCLVFRQQSKQCRTDYCQNNGQCIENVIDGTWDFACVCSGCTFGALCQLMTSQYVLSFDMMLGQDIRASESIRKQPFLINFVLFFIICMIFFGTISNYLSFITFRQRKVREHGCAIYLLCLCCVGQIGLLTFASRYFYLLITQLYNVTNHQLAYWICIILEYNMSVCPTLFDWLIVCVAAERYFSMVQGPGFKKALSVWWAKRIVLLLTIVIICGFWHEILIHKLVYDPRNVDEHSWCVVEFPSAWIKYYRLVINLTNLLIPGFIHLVATIFLLHKSARQKQKVHNNKGSNNYWMALRKQIPLYGTPFGLSIVSILRVVFSFTLVCITEQWHKYIYFIAYFISFAPLMATFPIFVLTAKTYKTEFRKVIERIIRKLRNRWTY